MNQDKPHLKILEKTPDGAKFKFVGAYYGADINLAFVDAGGEPKVGYSGGDPKGYWVRNISSEDGTFFLPLEAGIPHDIYAFIPAKTVHEKIGLDKYGQPKFIDIEREQIGPFKLENVQVIGKEQPPIGVTVEQKYDKKTGKTNLILTGKGGGEGCTFRFVCLPVDYKGNINPDDWKYARNVSNSVEFPARDPEVKYELYVQKMSDGKNYFSTEPVGPINVLVKDLSPVMRPSIRQNNFKNAQPTNKTREQVKNIKPMIH